MNESLKFKVAFLTKLQGLLFLSKFRGRFLYQQVYLCGIFFIDKLTVEELLWEHLLKVFHQTLKQFGPCKAHINLQLISFILLQVYRPITPQLL